MHRVDGVGGVDDGDGCREHENEGEVHGEVAVGAGDHVVEDRKDRGEEQAASHGVVGFEVPVALRVHGVIRLDAADLEVGFHGLHQRDEEEKHRGQGKDVFEDLPHGEPVVPAVRVADSEDRVRAVIVEIPDLPYGIENGEDAPRRGKDHGPDGGGAHRAGGLLRGEAGQEKAVWRGRDGLRADQTSF